MSAQSMRKPVGGGMDIFRAWTFAALAYLALNGILTLVLPVGLNDLYLICPFVAGAVAAGIHLWKGRGGWIRHVVAVLGAPLLLALYFVFVIQLPAGATAGASIWSVVLTLIVATLGAAGAHVFRILVSEGGRTA